MRVRAASRRATGSAATAVAVLAVAALGWGVRSFGTGADQPVWVTAGATAGSTPSGTPTDGTGSGDPGSAETKADADARSGAGAPLSATQSALPLLHANPVAITSSGFWSWALLDRQTGGIVGSTNLGQTQTTASMIKAWLAADYLRLAAERGQQPSTAALHQLSIMIRDSDNTAASATYVTVGKSASITRLIKICGLTESRAGSDWSHTLISARDAVRMGACIGDGRAAGSAWTDWVLTEMRSVRGSGRFGIVEALPTTEAAQTAIKNGWINRSDGNWHINCLAVAPTWVLAVEAVYPVSRGMAAGAAICREVARQLMAA
jgi:hypothetical protein